MDNPFPQLFPLLITVLMLLIPVLLIALVVWLFIRARRLAEERRRMLQQTAQMMGWTYLPFADFSMIPNLESYYLFSQGHSKKIENMMYGEIDGGRAAVFDYYYVTGSGKNRSTHNQTVVYFQSRQLQLPLFSLRPENVFHKVFEAFGYQDIDFAQRPEFSKRYLLRGQDEQNIRQIFSDRVLAFFETNQERISTDAGGDQLFFYQENVPVAPQNVRQFVEWGRGLLHLFKNPW
jgi:carbonic anhydrase